MTHSNNNAAEFAKIAIRVQTEKAKKAEDEIRMQNERDGILRLAMPGIEKALIQSAENGDHEAFLPVQDNVVIDHLKKLGFKTKTLKHASTPLGKFFLTETNHDKIVAKISSWELKVNALREKLKKTTRILDRKMDLHGYVPDNPGDYLDEFEYDDDHAEGLSYIEDKSAANRIDLLIRRKNSIRDRIDRVTSETVDLVMRLMESRADATHLTHLKDQDVINKIEWGVSRQTSIKRGAHGEVVLSPYLLNILAETRFKQLISGVIREIKSAAESGLMGTEIAIQNSQHDDKLDIVSGAYNNFSESKDVLIYVLNHKGFKCTIKPDRLLISWGKKVHRPA